MKLKHIILFISLISFSGITAQDNYYWIGGTGVWANLANWITEDGLIPGEVPDAYDNVYFNENSFHQANDTVWVFSKNAECKSMIWENLTYPVTIAGGADTTDFGINGSIQFDSLVSNFYQGNIHFLSSEMGNTVTMNGCRFFADIYFNGTGEWILQDTLLTWDTADWKAQLADPLIKVAPDPVIYLQQGTLNTNGQTLIAEGFASTVQNQRRLIIENSDIYILGSWSINAYGMDLEANNSLIINRGDISNFNSDGKSLVYNNVDKIPDEQGSAGMIESKSLRTQYNFVNFFGRGNLSGDDTPGIEGQFTIDSLIFYGPSNVSGPIDSINYGLFKQPTMVNSSESYFHKFILEMGGKIDGLDNVMDTIICLDLDEKNDAGIVVGRNYIDYIYFQTNGVISSYPGSVSEVNEAVFGGDGWLLGSNIFNDVHLSSGFWYQIGVDSLDAGGNATEQYKQVILNSLEVMHGCQNGMSLLSSTTKTVQGVIEYNGPGLTTEYLSVRDIKKTGSGTFTINNGIDIDNNDDIIINEITARDLYWVDGAGDWSDEEHWSTVEGQTPGDQCPPNIRDNVFVTGQSGLGDGDILNIDVKYACSNDQTWTLSESAILGGPDTNNIRIWGSMEYTSNMESEFGGNYYFESEHDFLPDGETPDPETINFAGKEVSKQTHFYGNEGAWILQDSLFSMNDTLFFTMGNLNTNDYTVRAYNFHSMDTLKRILSLGSSLMVVKQKNADAWLLNGFNIDFYCGTSTILSLGDLFLMPGELPNLCHVRSMNAFNLTYWDVRFNALGSLLKSEGICHYNFVDYLPPANTGEIVGQGSINVLTFQEGADFCVLKDTYDVNLVMAHGLSDTIKGMPTHNVVEAHFYQPGIVTGYNWIGDLHFHDVGDILINNTIDNCKYYNDGYIHGQNIFGTLIFSPSYRYYLQHDSIQYITTNFDVNGNCVAPIRIQSDSIGTQAKIEIQYDNPTIDYASFRDLHALEFNGNIPYTAEHSIDLGNNTNWILVDQPNDTLYWITGAGDWGDGSHWSFESGGDAIGCLPREQNTVVFDDNSFLTPNDVISVTSKNISCKGMLWEHSSGYSPTFEAPDTSALFIYGDLLLSKTMDYQFKSIVYFDEISGDKSANDSITTNGQIFLNDIVFQGINGEWTLKDSLTLEFLPPDSKFINLEHGKLITNGKKVTCGGLTSDFKNNRGLDIRGSEISLYVPNTHSWLINGENLELEAEGSTITNNGLFSFVSTYSGTNLKYHNIVMNGPLDSLTNRNNVVEYNVITQNGPAGWIGGNFIADSVLFNGPVSGMYKTSQTNVVIIDTANCYISDNHHINKGIVNQFGIISGNNDFDYFIGNSNCEFRGTNVFDTLVLMPGDGNTFYFEENKEQTVLDTLILRANICFQITIRSLRSTMTAYIRLDSGIVISDGLIIGNVGMVGDDSEFYAGLKSSFIYPNDPPPGWIMENAQGYIYGLADYDSFCEGEEYVISANNFNGDQNSIFYWENSSIPGGNTYTVTSPGTYHVRVYYSPTCTLEDDITLTLDYPPDLSIVPGPYCEGDDIPINVTPPGEFYLYEWSDGSYGSYATASPDNTELSVNVTNTTSGCASNTELSLIVHETPRPEDYIADDIILHFGETLDLDAGPGDTYLWQTDNPDNPIPNPEEQYITGFGSTDTTTYSVLVTYLVAGITDGCTAEADIKIAMYKRPGLGIPTAFSPNGEGPEENEVLKIQGAEIKQLNFIVYNRYGEIVFQTNDPTISWDGNISGHKQNKEVYTYYVKASFIDGSDEIEQTGNITLLR